MVDFLLDRKHRSRYAGQQSVDASINAGVVQGSGFGPSAYVVVASDLHPVHDHNVIVKFADDTYLIVLGSKRDTINKELEGIQRWALLSNLKLNPNKSKEMLFRRRTRTVILPPPLPGSVIVIVNSKLLKRHSKAKRRAPAYSRALRQIRGVFQ